MNKASFITALGKVPGLSGLLRRLASRYPEGSVVTIRSGFAQGMKWRRSHRYVNGYWLGHFESDVQAAVGRLLSPGDFFLDLGANAGFFSLVAHRRIGLTGKCVSVDPDPANCQNMAELAKLNNLTNWTILQRAVAEAAGKLRFAVAGPGSPTGHLAGDDESGEVSEVEVTTIDAICRQHGSPRLIKMDIEGAEVRALKGAMETLRDLRPAWLIELHSQELAQEIRKILGGAGYRFSTLAGEAIDDSRPLEHHVIAQL
jgi:FkbM family methyltransferase